MQLTEHNVHQFIPAISSLHWRINFYEFCHLLDLNPKYRYAEEKWEQFKLLNKGLSYFDPQTLSINSLLTNSLPSSNRV
jgi:hypothetical protein